MSDSPIFTALNDVLDVAASAFTQQELKNLDVFVDFGPPSEMVCGSLTTYSLGIAPTNGTQSIAGVPYRGHFFRVQDIAISLRECTPGMDSRGNEPSPAEKEEYARSTYDHVWGILRAIDRATCPDGILEKYNCSFKTLAQAGPIDERGQCAGWDIEFTLEIG